MDIKEESCFLDFRSEDERDSKDFVKKVKIETVTSSSDTKLELQEHSTSCSLNEEHQLIRFNETITETESIIDIKEEDWLKREDSCIDDIKDETHEEFYSTKPLSLYKEDVSSYTSDLFSSEDLGNDLSFNMNKDGPEDESDRIYQSQKRVVTDISLQHLKTHKLIHDGIKPHKCNTCNKGFTRSSSLKAHQLIHDGIKPHKCNICNKAFTELSNLKKHKLSHEGIKPHKCNICNKAFTHLSHLKTHKMIHEGIKPHKCNICNKAFTELSNLKTHKLSHQDIKPHKCNICDKAFTYSSHLKTHKLIHEGIKPHKCNICNKAFTELSNLKRHKLIHKDKKPQV